MDSVGCPAAAVGLSLRAAGSGVPAAMPSLNGDSHPLDDIRRMAGKTMR